jgi:hypothetical protein
MSNQASKVLNRGLSILLLLALLLGACGPTLPQATPTMSEPTATPRPTSTPPPTALPLPLPPPRLLFRSPAPGEAQPLDAPLELTFDQPMDRASVESAVVISPTVEGTFTWSDDRRVSFSPHELQRGLVYQVTVDDTARNVENTPLEEPIAFEFSTVGYLNVSQVVPAPGSDELDPNTVVTVVFDRPVVPLTAISRQSELPTPLTFMPPVRGEGEWLNTSIYLFRPEEGFLPATNYKARVAAGLTDTTGGVLAKDYTWEFTTIQPVVLNTRPPDSFDYFGPSDVISVTFNQPMDHTSAQTSFSLMVDDEPVDGTFRWSGGETSTDWETMVFVPDEPLPRSTEFKARLVKGAQAKAGNMGTSADKAWTFRSVRSPGIVEIVPEDGEKDVAPGSSVRITFSSPMQLEGFMDHLTISPQVTKVYTYWSEYNTRLAISFQQDPATPYSISLDADTSDQYGATLGEAARVRFITGDLRPYAALNPGSRLSTFNAYTDTVVYASHRNVSRLDLSLYELHPAEFTTWCSTGPGRSRPHVTNSASRGSP